MLVFVDGRNPEKNPRSIKRTNEKLNRHETLSTGIEPGSQRWEAGAFRLRHPSSPHQPNIAFFLKNAVFNLKAVKNIRKAFVCPPLQVMTAFGGGRVSISFPGLLSSPENEVGSGPGFCSRMEPVVGAFTYGCRHN